jgi:hypothetical protein
VHNLEQLEGWVALGWNLGAACHAGEERARDDEVDDAALVLLDRALRDELRILAAAYIHGARIVACHVRNPAATEAPLMRVLVLETRADLVVLVHAVRHREDVVCLPNTDAPWRAADERAAVDLPQEARLRFGSECDGVCVLQREWQFAPRAGVQGGAGSGAGGGWMGRGPRLRSGP